MLFRSLAVHVRDLLRVLVDRVRKIGSTENLASHVNGQILGRTDFAYTIYQHPKQVAYMYREGGFDVDGVGENFDKILGQHLQHVGMSMPGGMEHKK